MSPSARDAVIRLALEAFKTVKTIRSESISPEQREQLRAEAASLAAAFEEDIKAELERRHDNALD